MGPDDVMHILLAKSLGCAEFITFDGDFAEIATHVKLAPLLVTVLPQKF